MHIELQEASSGVSAPSWAAAELATPMSVSCYSTGTWAPWCGALACSAYTQAASLDLCPTGAAPSMRSPSAAIRCSLGVSVLHQ